MKKTIINFGDNRLFGAVGEWGLVLTDLAGAAEDGPPPAIQPRNSCAHNSFVLFNPGFSFLSWLYRVGKEMHESVCRVSLRTLRTLLIRG